MLYLNILKDFQVKDKRELIKRISCLIYDRFVVNLNAAGIQQNNGQYITKYIPVSSILIENMILSHGAMGCYQQGYKSGNIKWICFDFDCKDKNNPNIVELDERILQFTNVLDKLGIRYLKEFSGRRGIHIWVIFTTIIKKRIGYIILREILKQAGFELFESDKWGLDLFPATDSSRGNKVGKQVKFPLSCHKKTKTRSFFFNGSFVSLEDTESDCFFSNQLTILENYNPNDLENIVEKLGIDCEYKRTYEFKYRKYKVFGQVNISSHEVIDILSRTNVFKSIFNRMKSGQALSVDWTVLLGTLAHCDDDSSILKGIFEEFPTFDEGQTQKNIDKLKDYYYPATFGYLYQIYGMDREEALDPNATGLSYLMQQLGVDCENLVMEKYHSFNESIGLSDISNTIRKEQLYLLDNDEAPDVYIWNRLNMLNYYDKNQLQDEIKKVKTTGSFEKINNDFRVFDRIESEDRIRKMVSLSAHDRILTTHIALLFYCEFGKKYKKWNSYSFLPSLTSKNDIFFAWYFTWSKYIRQIRSFVEVPFFDNYSIVYIDLKGFYDHVDFIVVSDYVSNLLDTTLSNYLNALLEYNDYVMTHLNNGVRMGVPQGPAYARIISEVFLNLVLDEIMTRYEGKVFMYRYVDDIVFVCEPDLNPELFYSSVEKDLMVKGLPINEEKSRCFGRIGNLSEEDCGILLHKANFNNYLRDTWDGHILLDEEKKENLLKYIRENEFDIGYLGLFFSSETSDVAKKWCFDKYGKIIFESRLGRGSNFKRFYQYLFSNYELIKKVINNHWIDLIPLDSLNFSNFISVLYIFLQNNRISWQGFLLIRDCYLYSIKECSEICVDDKVVLDSLLDIKDSIC